MKKCGTFYNKGKVQIANEIMSNTESTAVYCRQCGSEIRTDVNFCPSCGSEQPDTASTTHSDADSPEQNSSISESSQDKSEKTDSTQATDGSQSHTELDSVDVDPSALLFSNLNDDQKHCQSCGESRHLQQRQCQNCYTELIDSESTFGDYSNAEAKKCPECGVGVPGEFTHCYNCGEPDPNLISSSSEESKDTGKATFLVSIFSDIKEGSGKLFVGIIDFIVILIMTLYALEGLWSFAIGDPFIISFIGMLFFAAIHGVIVVGKSIVYE